MQEEDKRKIKVGIAISAFAIVFYLALKNANDVMSFLANVASIFVAFIIGVCFAFVLNLLMTFFEKKWLSKVNEKKHPKFKKYKRGIAVIMTLLVFLGAVTALIAFIIPQLAKSIKTLIENVPSYMTSLEKWANGVLLNFGISTNIVETITNYLTEITDYIISLVGDLVPKVFEVTKSITSGVVNVFLGFIIGIYMLFCKETLLKNCKRALYAFTPLKVADYIKHVYRLIKSRFTGFVTGQLTEALIVGLLCFTGMSIFRMDYALLISVIVGVTNMIPIVGPIIGAIPGALIMLMVDPIKALWFIVFMIILQQVESNLIYPKVVGDSIGLPGLWVLFAIIVGGALFNFAGVLLGVPTFAVIYTLVSELTEDRLKKKKLQI